MLETFHTSDNPCYTSPYLLQFCCLFQLGWPGIARNHHHLSTAWLYAYYDVIYAFSLLTESKQTYAHTYKRRDNPASVLRLPPPILLPQHSATVLTKWHIPCQVSSAVQSSSSAQEYVATAQSVHVCPRRNSWFFTAWFLLPSPPHMVLIKA